MSRCAACGHEAPAGSRFCPACGGALEPEASPREARKTVTVVFVDLVGSTALGESLDPEAARHVLSRYFEEVRTILERHGGTVEKFIGDAVMAVFGIPVAHEDDALRAVRAAAEIRSALAGLNEELDSERGVRLQTRTGVNTGEVVVGDASQGQGFVTGDAVNIAARLEQAARPGEILIGQATLRLAEAAVEVEPVEPLDLKGKVEPVSGWRLLGVRDEASAFVRRLDAPMVGRDDELAILVRLFDAAVRDGNPVVAHVIGPAGIGKSRLVNELVARVGDRARVLLGRCLPYGEGITYHPLAEVVRQLVGTNGNENLSAFLAHDPDGDEVVRRLGAATGEGGGASGEEIFWAARRLFESVARERPLVLIFDDLHWAEPTFLDLLEYLAGFSRQGPLLMIGLARPELFELRPDWAQGDSQVVLRLGPLDDSAADKLLAGVEAETRRRIAQAAEGNPLFVEQMLAMLEEGGEVTVPPTIQALLAARIDRLDAAERATLEPAAVEGKLFHLGAVTALSPEDARPSVPGRVLRLLRKELIRPDRSLFSDDDGFRFGHILIRDAAYDAMSKELRADLHERFADWLVERTGRERTHDEIVGYHLEQAFRFREAIGPVREAERELAERARLALAGQRALDRSDMTGAVNLLGRALAVTARENSERREWLIQFALAQVFKGDWQQATESLDQAIESAVGAGDRRIELWARLELCFLSLYTGSERGTRELQETAEAAISVFEEHGDERGLAHAWMHLAGVHHAFLRIAARQEAFERALVHAERSGDERLVGRILIQLGGGYVFGPTAVEEGIRRCRDILDRYPRPQVQAVYRIELADLLSMTGNFGEARALCGAGRALAEELGLGVARFVAAAAAASIERYAGDLEAAEREFRLAYEIVERMGAQAWLTTVAGELGQVLYRQGRLDDAQQMGDVCRSTADQDDVMAQMQWRCLRAKLLARGGSCEEGEQLVREALALAEETDALNMHAETLLDLSEVLRLARRGDAAAEAAKSAVKLFEQKGNTVAANYARSFAGKRDFDREPSLLEQDQ